MNKTLSELKKANLQLKKAKAQLHALLHELMEAFYRTISKNSAKETSSAWTLNPDLEQLLKAFSNLKNSKRKTNQATEFSLAYFDEFGQPLKEFFGRTKGKTKGKTKGEHD